MDMDELLAASLQAEEQAAAGNKQKPGTTVLLELLQYGINKAQTAEDAEAQQAALEVMPLEQLRREAADTMELNRLLGEHDTTAGSSGTSAGQDDLLVQGMLRWFKRDFFKWVDQPACELCGSANTTHTGMVPPNLQEQAHAAQRVEAYHCSICNTVTRFPRYTDVKKLLTTRRGRCGEWAQAFLLLLRAAGFSARHITDSADHVWCEYYSEALGRWVHVDACEQAWDTPLLYEGGWGKQLAYVFSASMTGVVDVTRRYVLQPAAVGLRRRLAPEAWLSSTINRLSSELRTHLDLPTRRKLAMLDAAEALQLMSLEEASQPAASGAALPGRQSGAAAWRNARGEAGSSTVAVAAPGTPYRRAPDTDLPHLFAAAGRLTAGVCRCSGENPGMEPSQVVDRLFDGSLSSKWLDFGGGGPHGSAWAEYRLLPGHDAVVVTHYDLVAAEDCPERDPCCWLLEAVDTSSGNDAHTWVVLDQRENEQFSQRNQLRSFSVPASARMASRQWRLRVTRTAEPATANSVQICCWNLYSVECATVVQEVHQQQQQQLNGASAPRIEDVAQGQGQNPGQIPPVAADDLLYMNKEACSMLAAAACGGDALDSAAGAATDNPSVDTAAVAMGTVRRVLENMKSNPTVPKFWQLSTAGSRVQLMMQQPLLFLVLLSAGFRPLIAVPSNHNVDTAIRLMADHHDSSDSHAAVGALLKLLHK